MSRDKALFDRVRHPLKVRVLRVRHVTSLTPAMRRITFTGPDLEGFCSLASDDHVKVFFPRPGEEMPVLPAIGPLGVVLPKLGPKPIARDYTPLCFDPVAGELDIDFFLHGHGVASAWAANATEGQVVGVAGPRGSFVPTRPFAWELFVADETAFPEMHHRIERLPAATRVRLVAVVNGCEEEQPLPKRDDLEVRWVHRPHPDADASDALVEAVRALGLPDGEGFAWVAGEASQVRAVYRHLVRERGLPTSHIHTSGHWKRGVVAHDHHQPIRMEDE